MKLLIGLLLLVLIASIQSCEKCEPTIIDIDQSGENGISFCTDQIAKITVPQEDVSYTNSFYPLSDCISGEGQINADTVSYGYRLLNPNNPNEFCYLSGDSQRGRLLWKYNICDGQAVQVGENYFGITNSWNKDGYIYYKSSNGNIYRRNSQSGEDEFLLNKNFKDVFENSIRHGKLFTQGINQEYYLYDANKKIFTDTIPYIKGKPIVISDSTVAFLDNYIRIFNLEKNTIIDSFLSSCDEYDRFLYNVFSYFDGHNNVMYYTSFSSFSVPRNKQLYKMNLSSGVETEVASPNFASYALSEFSVVGNYIIKGRNLVDTIDMPKCYLRVRQRISFENMDTEEERDLILPGLYRK